MGRLTTFLLCLGLALPAHAQSQRPQPRPYVEPIPTTMWDFRSESDDWSRGALSALRRHGKPLVTTTPRDILDWCPGYARASEVNRRAFWVGFLSTLAKHESRWRPAAVGGGGLWYGLLQILPATARGYGCRATSGDALKDGASNLSCAIRIMARTVTRDGVIHGRYPRWSGVAADWGPMRSDTKVAEMQDWLKKQDYCQMTWSPRPTPRPFAAPVVATAPVTITATSGPRPRGAAPLAQTEAPISVAADLPDLAAPSIPSRRRFD